MLSGKTSVRLLKCFDLFEPSNQFINAPASILRNSRFRMKNIHIDVCACCIYIYICVCGLNMFNIFILKREFLSIDVSEFIN